jgi:hypothetical protein
MISQIPSYLYCLDAMQITEFFADRLRILLYRIDSIDTLQLLQTTRLSGYAWFRKMDTGSAAHRRTVL